jgi:predicted esterase
VRGVAIAPPAEESLRPRFASLTVERHARVALLGDEGRATEAWLVLHGYGMTAQGILHWFRAAARPDRLLVAPEGLSRFYQDRRGLRTVGASWMTREDREHEMADQLDYLDQVAARWLDGPERLEVHGFSQGVAVGFRWVAARRRKVDRLVGWGSPSPSDVAPADLLEPLAGGTTHLVIGEEDRFFATDLVQGDAERLIGGGLPVELHRVPGGHTIDEATLARFAG